MQVVNDKLQDLKKNLSKTQIDDLPKIRESVLQLQLPDGLVNDNTASILPNNVFINILIVGKGNLTPSNDFTIS